MIIDLNIQCQAMPINTTDLERQEKRETTQLITVLIITIVYKGDN